MLTYSRIKREVNVKTMSNQSLGEFAKNYKSKQGYKNITELPKFSTDVLVQQDTGVDAQGQEFSYNYIEVNGDKYKMPDSVIAQIQACIIENANQKEFKVVKSGSGLNTRYTAVALQN